MLPPPGCMPRSAKNKSDGALQPRTPRDSWGALPWTHSQQFRFCCFGRGWSSPWRASAGTHADGSDLGCGAMRAAGAYAVVSGMLYASGRASWWKAGCVEHQRLEGWLRGCAWSLTPAVDVRMTDVCMYVYPVRYLDQENSGHDMGV